MIKINDVPKSPTCITYETNGSLPNDNFLAFSNPSLSSSSNI